MADRSTQTGRTVPLGRGEEDGRYFRSGSGCWLEGDLVPGGKDLHHIPEAGYVGAGIVTGKPMPFAEATVDIDGQQHLLEDLPLTGNSDHSLRSSLCFQCQSNDCPRFSIN